MSKLAVARLRVQAKRRPKPATVHAEVLNGAHGPVSAVLPLVVTVRYAAAMLSVSRSRIYELIAQGVLATNRIGRSRRVSVKSIQMLLASTSDVPRRAA